MKCKKHKRYKAQLKPRCDCTICWGIYLETERADYRSVCQEIDRRSPNDSLGMSHIEMGWGCEDEELIMDMLRKKKRELENDTN